MSIPIRNRIFYKKYFNVYCPVKLSIDSISNTQKLHAKKRFTIKNKFTFENEFRHDRTNSESRAASPELLHGQSNSRLRYDNISIPAHGFISTDLLSGEGARRQRNIKRLSETKKDSKPSLKYIGEILFGVHPVYLALLQKKRVFHHLYVRKEIDSSSEGSIPLKAEIVRLAKSMDIPISHIDAKGLKILAPGDVHQGVCLDAGFLPLPTWNEDQSKNDVLERSPLWLVLDEILDPMNVGAVIRSAYYFGVNKLFTVKGNSCKLSPTVSKASSGSLEVMNIYQLDNLEDFIKKRKDGGWSIVSTLVYTENKPEFCELPVNIAEFNILKPTVLILGNEGRGISEAVLRLCDSLISIKPGRSLCQGIDSLNVSVAAGVLLYALDLQTKNFNR